MASANSVAFRLYRVVTSRIRGNEMDCRSELRLASTVGLLLAIWSAPALGFGDIAKFRTCDPSKIGSAFSNEPKLLEGSEVVVHATVLRLLRSEDDHNTSIPTSSHLAVISVDQVAGPGSNAISPPVNLILNIFNTQGSCNLPLRNADTGFVSGVIRAETREHRFPNTEKLDFLLVRPDPSRFLRE